MVTRRFMISASALVIAAASTQTLRAIAAAREDAGHFPDRHSEAEWRRLLTADRFAVLRGGGSETPFSSPLLGEHRRGSYACAGCRQDAFASAAKVDDGRGWPVFWVPFYGAVVESEDRSASVFRAAVRCSRSGSHLGVLSRDVATPTGLHYRIDGLSLAFTPAAVRDSGSS